MIYWCTHTYSILLSYTLLSAVICWCPPTTDNDLPLAIYQHPLTTNDLPRASYQQRSMDALLPMIIYWCPLTLLSYSLNVCPPNFYWRYLLSSITLLLGPGILHTLLDSNHLQILLGLFFGLAISSNYSTFLWTSQLDSKKNLH